MPPAVIPCCYLVVGEKGLGPGGDRGAATQPPLRGSTPVAPSGCVVSRTLLMLFAPRSPPGPRSSLPWDIWQNTNQRSGRTRPLPPAVIPCCYLVDGEKGLGPGGDRGAGVGACGILTCPTFGYPYRSINLVTVHASLSSNRTNSRPVTALKSYAGTASANTASSWASSVSFPGLGIA